MSNHPHAESCNHGGKTLASYWVGYILSLILFAAAFCAVHYHVFSVAGLYVTVVVLGLLILLVQVVFCFMRLSTGYKDPWNLISLLFTIFVVLVVVTGSLWIMYNLNYNMMPH